MIRITVYAGSDTNNPSHSSLPSTTVRTVDDGAVSETLRQLGLEWRQADYFGERQVVITLDPVADESDPNVKALVGEAVGLLERTGLL